VSPAVPVAEGMADVRDAPFVPPPFSSSLREQDHARFANNWSKFRRQAARPARSTVFSFFRPRKRGEEGDSTKDTALTIAKGDALSGSCRFLHGCSSFSRRRAPAANKGARGRGTASPPFLGRDREKRADASGPPARDKIVLFPISPPTVAPAPAPPCRRRAAHRRRRAGGPPPHPPRPRTSSSGDRTHALGQVQLLPPPPPRVETPVVRRFAKRARCKVRLRAGQRVGV